MGAREREEGWREGREQNKGGERKESEEQRERGEKG